MKTYHQFHDGSLDGILLENGGALLFLSTHDKEHFVLEVGDLQRLEIDNFRQGSSVFDLTVREQDELTVEDMVLSMGFTDLTKAAEALEKARLQSLLVLEISSSYGASCFLLAKSCRLVKRKTGKSAADALSTIYSEF